MKGEGSPATLGGSDSHQDPMVLPPGQRVGRYEITSVLGQGSFGITYSARDSQLGRNVALKEYLPAALAVRSDGTTVRPRSTQAAADFAWGRERFVAEGRTIASLHEAPGIVRVLDFLEANGTAYIVMELVRGETLADRLKSGPLDLAAVLQILTHLLLGLEQVHAAGFLHRDIKPGNILLDRHGKPTLIDFGASREAMAERTTALTAIFTPGYAAVEQVTSARQGPWTDIYGVAATLYHAVAGKPPPNSIDRIIEDTCVPLVSLAPKGYPRALLAGIDAGLAVRVVNRPQSIDDWRSLFEGSAPSADATIAMPPLPPSTSELVRGPEPKVTPPEDPSAPSRGRAAVWAASLIVAALLVTAGIYLAFSQRSPEQEVERAREALATAEQAARRKVSNGAIMDTVSDHASAQASAQQAQTAQQQREAEEAKRKADTEAQQRQQAEAADRARALEEAQAARDRLAAAESARKQMEEEAARAKAQADAAAKQQADADAAKRKVEEEAAASKKSDDDQRKASEAAEGALRLSLVDKQRIQVALTALGFDTRGADGAFGPRTRDMIGNWQKRQNQPSTGFLSGAQQQALLREAAPAVARFDDEQKKADEARKKAEDEAKSKAAQQPAPAVPAAVSPAVQSTGAKDGMWFGAVDCKHAGRMSVQGNVVNGNGHLAGVNITASLSILGAGANVKVVSQAPSGPNGTLAGEVRGRSVFAKGVLQRTVGSGLDECTASLVGP